MNEKDLQERIREDAERIEIPDRLKPEQIEKRLQAAKKQKQRTWIKIMAAAAVLLVAAGGIVGLNRGEAGNGEYGDLYDRMMEQSVMPPDAVMDTPIAEDNRVLKSEAAVELTANDYSETNIQVEGVDEGDIVKTDGKYIYVLDRSYNTVTIIKAGSPMKTCSVINLETGFTAEELYAAGDQLSVIGNKTNSEKAITYTYNLKDKEHPQEEGSVSQSGDLCTSRLQGEYLYVFSRYYPNLPSNKKKFEQYIPMVDGDLLRMPEILIPEKSQSSQYLVITAIDLKKPGSAVDRKAAFSSGETFYVSQDYIYAASDRSDDSSDTEIRKFSYKDGKLQYKAMGTVKGYFNDSFSMDEYKGNLRLVTTLDANNGSTYNNVYVLGEDMKELGSIRKLAKDERIYSARFLGDKGYFVTYRQTDPLFSVDLSDPKEPKILGALKIPGFSQYLHFYGKDRLLGIGMAANKDGVTSNVKLSMFNIRDPKNVIEEKTYELKDTYAAEALSNHKAVMIDPEKNLFGFAAEGQKGAYYSVYQYTDGSFIQLFRKSVGRSAFDVRGLYIGESFYLVQDDRITRYRLSNFEKIETLNI